MFEALVVIALVVILGPAIIFGILLLVAKVAKNSEPIDPDSHVNTGRMKFWKIALGHRALKPEEVLLPESEDGEDTIEMVFPRNIIPDARPPGIHMVCYAKNPDRPFGWMFRVDRAGRARVRRFDGIFVRRMRHNLVVLA